MKDIIGIGLIGCGGISGAHLPQIEKAEGARLTALCDINPARLNAAGDKYGIPENRRFLDYHDLIACPDVDAVDICTPNNMHVPMCNAAIDVRKPFCCEKPLGISTEECEALRDRAKAEGILSMICFSYRFREAMRYARELVDNGEIGNVVNIYASYLKSSTYMPGRRLDWRFDKTIAQYGVSGDLGVHILDLTTFLAGDMDMITADIGTVIKQRKRLDSEELVDVTTDDWCHILARFKGGASATYSISRAMYGNNNHIIVEMSGEKGGLRFDLNNNKLEYRSSDMPIDKMREIEVPPEYRAGQTQTFINLLHGKRDKYIPTLDDAVKMQRILDAILESADSRSWVKI